MDIGRFWKNIDRGMDKIRLLDKLIPLERLFEERVKIGLDIGNYSVKMVQIKETPQGPTLVKLGYKEIGESSSGSLARSLGELWDEQKVRARRVRLAISDPSIYLRHISIPRVPEEELAKAIKWQAEKYAPFPITDAIVDFQTLGADSKKGSDQMEIIVVAVKRETVNNYLSILKGTKLVPTNLDLCPFAVAKSFLKNYSVDKEEMIAVIDIGDKITSVIITKGESLQFIRNMELGGNDFTKALAKGLNVEKVEAEKIKRKADVRLSEADEKNEGQDIFSIIEPLLTDLAKEINRSFTHCETELLIQRINKVILCGGGARFKALDKFLAEKLGRPVETGNPFKKISIKQTGVDASILEGVSSSLMAALGAAL